MVFNLFSNNIPTAWIVTNIAKTSYMAVSLKTINEKIKKLHIDYKPIIFIVSNINIDTNVIKWALFIKHPYYII